MSQTDVTSRLTGVALPDGAVCPGCSGDLDWRANNRVLGCRDCGDHWRPGDIDAVAWWDAQLGPFASVLLAILVALGIAIRAKARSLWSDVIGREDSDS